MIMLNIQPSLGVYVSAKYQSSEGCAASQCAGLSYVAPKAQHSPRAWGSAPGFVKLEAPALKARFTFHARWEELLIDTLIRAFSAWIDSAIEFLGRCPRLITRQRLWR